MYRTADFLAPWQDFIDSLSPSQQGILLVYSPQIRFQVTSLVYVQSVFAIKKTILWRRVREELSFSSEKQNGLNLNFSGLKNTDILKNGHILYFESILLKEKASSWFYIFSMQLLNLFHFWVRICPGSQGAHMCSSGHNLAAKIHPNYLPAFCVVEIKCKVLDVPSLFALMEVRSVNILQDQSLSSY